MDQKIARVSHEHVALAPYDLAWPELFAEERDHLRHRVPATLIGRIEHFGSTAVPGLIAKPIIDVLVEVHDLESIRREVPRILEAEGYDYFWRPTFGDDVPPFYAWFIKRDSCGMRTHHIHMVEPHFEHWERLLFRDYLRLYPDVARAYGALKSRLAEQYPDDRVAYTAGKTRFVTELTQRAKAYFGDPSHLSQEIGR